MPPAHRQVVGASVAGTCVRAQPAPQTRVVTVSDTAHADQPSGPPVASAAAQRRQWRRRVGTVTHTQALTASVASRLPAGTTLWTWAPHCGPVPPCLVRTAPPDPRHMATKLPAAQPWWLCCAVWPSFQTTAPGRVKRGQSRTPTAPDTDSATLTYPVFWSWTWTVGRHWQPFGRQHQPRLRYSVLATAPPECSDNA